MEERIEAWHHEKSDVTKETILKELRKNGGRVTKQREALIDIILKEECNCCKELYYLAQKIDPGIGIATIYRTVNALEELGVIQRKNAYHIKKQEYIKAENLVISFDDESSIELSGNMLLKLMEAGMNAKGMSQSREIKNIFVKAV